MNVSDQVRTVFCGALDLAGGSEKAGIYLKDAALTKKSSLDIAGQEDTTGRKVIKGITHAYTLGDRVGLVCVFIWVGSKTFGPHNFSAIFSLISQLITVQYTIRRPAYCTLFRSTLFVAIHLMTLCLGAPCLGAFTLMTLCLGALRRTLFRGIHFIDTLFRSTLLGAFILLTLCLGAPCLGAFTLLTLCLFRGIQLMTLCLGATCLGAFTLLNSELRTQNSELFYLSH